MYDTSTDKVQTILKKSDKKDRLKIAFLHRAGDPYTLDRIKYFSSNTHNVYSITFDLGEKNLEQSNFKQIKLKKRLLYNIPFVKRIIHYSELKRILNEIQPDVLHVVSALNLIYINYKLPFIKIIENQGSDVLVSPVNYKFLVPYYKRLYKKADAVVQDSLTARESGIKYGAPNDYKVNKVIEIGIDFNIFNKDIPKGIIRNKYDLQNRQIIFHSRSISDNIYNIDTILKSIIHVRNIYPECILILTAKKEQLNSGLMEIITSNKLDNNILFAGFQDRYKDIKYYYRDADVNISVPSSDSSPFSVYESMACLTPNVVTDLPWVHSKFIPGKHLLTCENRNEVSLADKIIKVFNKDHELDLLSAYNVVDEKINLQKENEKLETLYRTLLKNKKNENL